MPLRALTHKQRERNRGNKDAAYEARSNRAYGIAEKIRKSKRWIAFRKSFVSKHPLCCDPYKLHAANSEVRLTEQVHHVKLLVERPELAFIESNCKALCAACHHRVSMYERHAVGIDPFA